MLLVFQFGGKSKFIGVLSNDIFNNMWWVVVFFAKFYKTSVKLDDLPQK